MSNELYYRGSCTYEIAVKNRLARLEESGERNAQAILSGIQNMEYGVRTDIRKSTYAIVASQEALAKTYRQGFDAVNNTLNLGFQMVAYGMGRINDSIDAMSEAICNKLDEIHDIVNNPRLTAARELFRRASTNFEKGYYEEALEDCKQALEKEKTDFISWYLLGQIYLFGAGKFSNVINLPEAETALTNAAKYIDADIDSSEEAQKLASQIYYHLGYVKWLISNDLLVEGKSEESDNKLEEAEKNTAKSIQLDGSNLKIYYEHVKQLHFLGKDKEALTRLKKLICEKHDFALISLNDKNLESIWPYIEKVILILRDETISEIDSGFTSAWKKILHTDCFDVNMEAFDHFCVKFENLVEQLKNADFYTVIEFCNETLPKLKAEWNEIIEDSNKILQDYEKEASLLKEAEDDPSLLRTFYKKYGYLPKSITVINKNLFKDCNFLRSITIPEGVTVIEDNAFKNCDNLCEVHLPYTLETIGKEAFSGCRKLSNIEIPDSVTTIGQEAFSGCISLSNIEIPDSVTKIGCGAFYECKNLSNIEIPDSVTTIGASAFAGCESLISIEIPDSVTTIGASAFARCESLISIEIPDSVTAISVEAFAHCENLRTVEFPDTLKFIRYSSFKGCTALTNVVIPNNVCCVESYAFENCSSLKNVEIQGIIHIDEKAFLNCKSLTTVKLLNRVKVYSSYCCDDLMIFPLGVTKIEISAFKHCHNLDKDTRKKVKKGWFIRTFYYVMPIFGRFAEKHFHSGIYFHLEKMVEKIQLKGCESTNFEDNMRM